MIKLDELEYEPKGFEELSAKLTEDYRGLDFRDREAVFKTYKPRIRLPLEEAHKLDEATYKDIAGLIDPNFLSQNIRANYLENVRFMGFEGDTMIFNVDSDTVAKANRTQFAYAIRVQFPQWAEIGQDPDLNDYNERARMLLWVGDIKLDCTCPSFLYWGYQYILTVLDAAINPETRPPKERNPKETGSVCKHLNRVLRVLPFHMGEIANAMKQQFG